MRKKRIAEFEVEVPGGRLLCLRFGRGERPLVLIPGLRTSSLKGSAAFAAWYYRIFSRDFTVYVLDRKEPVSPGCTIHDLAEDSAAAMEALGLRDACIFAASQGGMIAQDLAIHHPELVRRMVLAVTASRSNPTMEEAVGTWVGLIRRGDLEGFARDYTRRGYSEAYLRKYSALLPLVFRFQKMMSADRFITLAEACLTCDVYDRLEDIRCPVLVLGAEKDRVVSGEASRELAERLGCACYLYPELSHEAYSEAGDFNRRVYDFLIN